MRLWWFAQGRYYGIMEHQGRQNATKFQPAVIPAKICREKKLSIFTRRQCGPDDSRAENEKPALVLQLSYKRQLLAGTKVTKPGQQNLRAGSKW